MRIALVHSFYSEATPSGENTMVRLQAEALSAAGHEVVTISRHTDRESASLAYPVRSALRVATGHGPSPRARLERFNPDVTHVHNLFPNIGEEWLSSWVGPLVVTLHNFRPICAAGTLFRDGHVCTECPDGDPWAGVKHGCYRGSAAKTLPLAIHNRPGLGENRVLARADRVVTLSERSRDLFVSYGLDPALVRVVPNGLNAAPTDTLHLQPRNGWVFAGRLTAEKGVAELADVWPRDEQLTVLGEGPLRPSIERLAPSSWAFRGTVASRDLLKAFARAEGVLIPSLCFEGFPTVLLEALSVGTPVIARAGNSAADFVQAHRTGSTYCGAASLAASLVSVRESGPALRAAASSVFSELLSTGAWVMALERVYDEAIKYRVQAAAGS